MPGLSALQKEFREVADPEIAQHSQRFFKTGPGEYGEGDLFWGIRVPDQRRLARKYKKLDLSEIKKLLDDKYHEARLTGLFILVLQYEKARKTDEIEHQRQLVEFYLSHTNRVNNWDLVDSSAHKLLGDLALRESSYKKVIQNLSNSEDLWEKRIAMISSAAFINAGDITLTLELAEKLWSQKHDLLQKATGWMLREAAKVEMDPVVNFLFQHKSELPRTLLRYAIERFPKDLRSELMAKE